MLRIGIVAAIAGIGLAMASLMMQFLGVSPDILIQWLVVHVAVVVAVLAGVARCFMHPPHPLNTQWDALWDALPGLAVRFAGLLIFVVATAELALWLVHDLTGRSSHWSLHIPSALTVIYALGACCCIAAERREASGP